jgi:hypothetical protein
VLDGEGSGVGSAPPEQTAFIKEVILAGGEAFRRSGRSKTCSEWEFSGAAKARRPTHLQA